MANARATSDGKAKSRKNWPMIIAGCLCVAFIVGIWANSYRVTHMAAMPAPTTQK